MMFGFLPKMEPFQGGWKVKMINMVRNILARLPIETIRKLRSSGRLNQVIRIVIIYRLDGSGDHGVYNQVGSIFITIKGLQIRPVFVKLRC